MATTATRSLHLPLGPKVVEVWSVSIGAGDTTALWDTGLDNVDYVGISTDSDQAFGGVYRNYSDAGTTVAAGNVYVAGLANSSACNVLIVGN